MLALYDADVCILPSQPPTDEMTPTVSVLGHSFIQCQAGPLSMLVEMIECPQLPLCGPRHMFRIRNVAILVGTGPWDSSGPLPPRPALCPSAWSPVDSQACSLCPPCPSFGRGSATPVCRQDQEGITWKLSLPQNPAAAGP